MRQSFAQRDGPQILVFEVGRLVGLVVEPERSGFVGHGGSGREHRACVRIEGAHHAGHIHERLEG